ncbi:MAG: MFS transporter [Ginsengibacter sp.]
MRIKTPSKRSSRFGVAGLFFIYGFCFASWASRIPNIQQKLNLTETQLGLVLFSLPVGLFISLPLSGWLVTKFGSKKIVIIAAILYSGVLIMLGSVNHVYQLVISLFLFGIGGNMGNISINTQAVGVETLYEKPIMGSFHGIWSLAGFTGAAFGTLMLSHNVAPNVHFLVIFFICLFILSGVFKYLMKKDVVAEGAPLFALPDKSLIVLGLIAFCSMICEGTMFDWSGIYFSKVVKASPSLVSAGYTAFMSTMAFSRFFSDHITAKIGFKRTIQLSGLLITTGLLLSVAYPTFSIAILGFLLVGVGVSSIVPQVYSAAGKSKKLSAGLALAAVSSIGFLGFLIGPPLIGMLAGISSLRLSFTIIALMGLMVSVLVTFTKETY